MKKLALICLVALGTSAFTMIAEDWKKVNVTDKVTVEMPVEPVEINTNGAPQKVKKCTAADSTEMATILIDFTAFGMTEEQIEGLKDTEEFKEQLKMGMTQGGGQILSESEGKYKDKYLYYQFEIKSEKDGKPSVSTNRMIFYKTYAITLGYKAGKNGENKELRDKYFNSLTIAE
ncbi:hypothetical protein KACHI17_00560 [Sediminibacterium sp. KACHI17]|jgi:hypothetical protein|uniref:Uncharacterized protein n=1 Tax=Sediminibacterium sp. KACHI17 TaxID=1751071 RepID=A0AAT9GEW5_9BACT